MPVSGVFRYLGTASPRARPPKPRTCPRSSEIGNTRRLRKLSRPPRPASPASASSERLAPFLTRKRTRAVPAGPPAGAKPTRKRPASPPSTGRSEADPETPRQPLVHAALGQQAASRLPAGQAPEHVLVVLGGQFAELQRAAPAGASGGRPRALLQLDPCTLGEDLQRAGGVDPLH